MENDIESRPATKEREAFLPSESIPEIRFIDGTSCRFNVDAYKNIEIISVKDYKKNELKDEEDYYVIPLFKNFKISVNKTLVPLRIALFLWYGVGKITSSYLTVFMQQKGLSLVEYSSVFSVAFIFQFLAAFASGIISDRLGNAKPVLMTHIVIVLVCVLAFLLSPKVVDLDGGSVAEVASENRSEEFMNNLQRCDELRRGLHRPLTVDTVRNRILRGGNHSEANLRYSFEECDDSNQTATPAFENPVPNATRLGVDFSNATSLPCGALDGNCTTAPTPRDAHGGRNVVFVYVMLMVTYLSSWSSIYRLMDATVMSFSRSHNVNFGRERFFSMSGIILITFMAGIVLDRFTVEGEDINYHSVYVFSACILCLVIVAVYCVKAQLKPQSRHMWRDGFRFARNMDVLAFFVAIFLLGSSFGFIVNFSAWFLEYLNAPTIVFGLQQTLSALYGLPLFLTSKLWLRLFGTQKLLVMGFLGYIIYGIGFSFLYEPWWCLLIQAASILTYHMLWVAVIVHSHSIAPESLVSTIIAIAGGTHFGLGRSIGTLSYGLTLDAVGPRTAFRIFAGVNLLSAICYVFFLCTRKSKVINPR